MARDEVYAKELADAFAELRRAMRLGEQLIEQLGGRAKVPGELVEHVEKLLVARDEPAQHVDGAYGKVGSDRHEVTRP